MSGLALLFWTLHIQLPNEDSQEDEKASEKMESLIWSFIPHLEQALSASSQLHYA